MTRKQAIIDVLRAFVNQRPGFELGNYATMADYRSDSRRATRQKADALQLLRDIELRDSITADDILKEAQGGRLAIEETLGEPEIEYTVGQYAPTEFRGAVARLCASVLWTWKREQCMPEPTASTVSKGRDAGRIEPAYAGLSAGDWLRASFKREYGHPLAERYFS